MLEALRKAPSDSIPDILNQAFHDVDMHLTRLAEQSEGKMHSGCTAVTAFLRLEDADGKQSFLPEQDPLQMAHWRSALREAVHLLVRHHVPARHLAPVLDHGHDQLLMRD